MKKLAGLIVLLSLAACAPTRSAYYWDNPDLGALSEHEYQSTFRKHRGYCRMMSETGSAPPQIMPSGGGFAGGWNMAQALSNSGKSGRIFDYCMESFGWVLMKKK